MTSSGKNISQLQTAFNKLADSSRFYSIERENAIWFYDCHTQTIFSINKNHYKKLIEKDSQKLSDFINDSSIEENSYFLALYSQIIKNDADNTFYQVFDPKCNVMINTSNRCNLNCSYCYRDKKNAAVNNVQNIRKAIEWVMHKYKPNASEFVFTYSMSSESSVDLQLLQEIKKDYVYYEPQFFNTKEIILSTVDEFYSQLKNDLGSKTKNIFDDNKIINATTIVEILNELLTVRNLYELLGMSEKMFEKEAVKEIRRRNSYSEWKAYRVNRWILEIKYSEFIDISQKPTPQYPGFSIFTNGTCGTSEYINFLKSIGMDDINISIDGPKEVHDFNRKFYDEKGSYDSVIANAQKIKDSGIIIRASSVITAHFPKPLKIAEHLKEKGFSSITMTPIRPGYEVSFTEKNINELLQGYDELFERIKQDLLHNDLSLLSFIKDDYSMNALNLFLSKNKQITRCNLENQIVINAKGDIYNCLYFESHNQKKIGNIDSGITNDQEFQIDKTVKNREPCNKCWARFLCGGTCFYSSFKMTGSIIGNEPVECKLRKHLAILTLDLLIFCKENNINLSNSNN